MLKKLPTILLWLTSAFILLYASAYFTDEAGKLFRWRASGDINSQIERSGDSTYVFIAVDASEFVSGKLPAVRDTVVMIGDSLVTRANFSRLTDSPMSVGAKLPIAFLHRGVRETAVIRISALDTSIYYPLVFFEILRIIIAFTFIGLGIWAFWKRSESEGVRVLTLFCFSFASFTIGSVTAISDEFQVFQIPFLLSLKTIISNFSAFFGAIWLHLQLVFPRRNSWLQKRKWAILLVYSPQILTFLSLAFPAAVNRNISNMLFPALMVIQFMLGFYFLFRNYQRSKDALERRQIKLVLIGSTLGLAPLGILILIFIFYPQIQYWSTGEKLLLIILGFIGQTITPFTYVYAMGRYGILDVEARLRKTARYLLTTVAQLALVFAVVYGFSQFLLRNTGTDSRGSTLFIAILLTMGVSRVQQRVQGEIDKRLYPERYNLRKNFAEFLQQLLAIPDRETLWSELRTRLRSGLLIDKVVPVLRDSEASGLLQAKLTNAPFEDESELIGFLQSEQRPTMVDEMIESGRCKLSQQEIDWLRNNKIALIVPLVVQSRLTGFLGLGFKTSQQDFTPNDMTILSSLGAQIAMANENLRLLEENVEKRRLEEQMRIARTIQSGFLPQTIPIVPGIEIAGMTKFCLDVAGDYYDIIPLEDGRTVLTVGDVMGKGAGAALLMANLQASLRTAVGGSISLSEMVFRINELIYRNTPPEQFITFFVGLFDPANKQLAYVNAGHNPPFVIRDGKKYSELTEGGPLLGVIPGVHYQQGEYALVSGDVVLLFTDGVTEAMNSSTEEFGEQRLTEVVVNGHDNPANDVLISIEKAVTEFHGSSSFEDDFTLLLVRVT
ncbi:MAG: SpoIIE family protein phosphatase [bacterium]|nr:SpoIIE family protein phosphatase [bacterium]